MQRGDDMSKSISEILDEYLQNDSYYNKLSDSDKMLDRIITRDTLGFQRHLLKVRIKEIVYQIFNH